jgi:hypothetical protein
MQFTRKYIIMLFSATCMRSPGLWGVLGDDFSDPFAITIILWAKGSDDSLAHCALMAMQDNAQVSFSLFSGRIYTLV